MDGHHRECAYEENRPRGSLSLFAEIIKPLMTRTDAHSNLLSDGYCAIIRCAFYILHTSYASVVLEISAAQGKQISIQIKTSNTYAGKHIERILYNSKQAFDR